MKKLLLTLFTLFTFYLYPCSHITNDYSLNNYRLHIKEEIRKLIDTDDWEKISIGTLASLLLEDYMQGTLFHCDTMLYTPYPSLKQETQELLVNLKEWFDTLA